MILANLRRECLEVVLSGEESEFYYDMFFSDDFSQPFYSHWIDRFFRESSFINSRPPIGIGDQFSYSSLAFSYLEDELETPS